MASGITPSHRHYLQGLVALFALYWGALAIAPYHRHDWLLENVLVAALALALLAGRRVYVPSRTAATLLFVYLCLHQLGAHYTYAQVPYDEAWRALTGESLDRLAGWERNQFDRLVHLSYGLLLAVPLREVMLRLGAGRWSYLLAIDVLLSTSAFYELVEWAGAELLGGRLGRTYVGAQNDFWDAQKDMALAFAGAILAMLATALWQRLRGTLHRNEG